MKWLLKAAQKCWVPLVVIAVVTAGGLVIVRFHGVFGAQHSAESRTDNIVSTIPKYVTYEVDGPAGTTGMISYVDERSQPQHERFTSLPWSKTLTTTVPSVFANLVAQGDSGQLSCRITVNGELRDHQGVDGAAASTFCLVKAA
ncbi:MmpS family transport accessory protein [Mycobacterium sp. OTB74]|jgi:hypothetical protein|uniref:MmpS family transport accessory protein n=1 Tax=Mycobacterium sp. OTB74 TaxID=1853452 RepID=UPI0024747122|nr:MmpS family transport accessory protein [Mycobacterium sp. OTB74]MDH6247172.1 hypothetical protein [Mycobacterium sp. OTB74]